MLLAHNLADVGYVLLRSHEVGEVIELQRVETAGDDGLAVALDGHDVVGVFGAAEVLQRLVQNLAALAQLDAQEDEGAVVDVPALAHPRHLQTVGDVDGRQHLGVDHRVDAHLLEKLLVLCREVLVVVDARHRLLRAESVGNDASRDVGGLLGGDADEEVGLVGSGLLQRTDTGGQRVVGHHVVLGDTLQALLVVVDEHAALVLARQQFRQMGAHGTGSGNDNLHAIYVFFRVFDVSKFRFTMIRFSI